jgi:hypothetical protein
MIAGRWVRAMLPAVFTPEAKAPPSSALTLETVHARSARDRVRGDADAGLCAVFEVEETMGGDDQPNAEEPKTGRCVRPTCKRPPEARARGHKASAHRAKALGGRARQPGAILGR